MTKNKSSDFQTGWSTEREEQAEAAIRALSGGARACAATVFVSAGGASWAHEAVWPGLGLELLARPRNRADLACAVEEALPGWQWSITSIPDPEAAWPLACFSLSPIGTGRADADQVGKAVKGLGFERSPLARAIEILDQAVGVPSARFRQLNLFDLENLTRIKPGTEALAAWRDLRDLAEGRGPGPGLGLAGLSLALQARALAHQLSQDCERATQDSGGRPRI